MALKNRWNHHQAPGLEALAMLEELRLRVAGQQQELADSLRAAGVSWQALGDACGITLQGARSRFSRPRASNGNGNGKR